MNQPQKKNTPQKALPLDKAGVWLKVCRKNGGWALYQGQYGDDGFEVKQLGTEDILAQAIANANMFWKKQV